MATISLNDLTTTGYSLFTDRESYLMDLDDEAMTSTDIMGGFTPLTSNLTPIRSTFLCEDLNLQPVVTLPIPQTVITVPL
jgi:hypothetical protein